MDDSCIGRVEGFGRNGVWEVLIPPTNSHFAQQVGISKPRRMRMVTASDTRLDSSHAGTSNFSVTTTH